MGTTTASEDSGYVMQLNNHYQKKKINTNKITYSFVPRPGTDIYTATVKLGDTGNSYPGAACTGKQAAKESAAKAAMTALGLPV